ncbi:nudC domain-containing protein 2-like [Adelges cooleyi]|uniref:nudC domain-containing protein 2-like n=1 Tax=Adelges cooleyi TaxID=133065 RepID=UPI0021802EA1|nr:nudC domain-containing protein 2-like [Adelges cooleyi]
MDIFGDSNLIVPCETEWGKWWQTLEEVHVEVNVPKGTKSKEVKVDATNTDITCIVAGKTIFSGKLFKKIKGSELIWSLEDGGALLNILLVKLNYAGGEDPWPSLMGDFRYKFEQNAYEEMKKSTEMEKLKEQVMNRSI